MIPGIIAAAGRRIAGGAGASSELASSEPSGGLWTPADISTVVWMDAQDAGTITLNSGNVSQWDDKSGNLHHLEQSTAGDQPEYAASAINGNPGVEFSSGINYMQWPDGVTIPASAYHFFYVMRPLTFYGNNSGIWRDGATSGGGDFHLVVASTRRPWLRANGENVLKPASGFQFATATNYVTSWGFVPSTSASVWANGVEEHTDTHSRAAATFDIYNFGYQSSTGERLHAYYGEIIILDRDPTTDERQKIEGYLAHKWGLEGDLPSDHPYKASAPTV